MFTAGFSPLFGSVGGAVPEPSSECSGMFISITEALSGEELPAGSGIISSGSRETVFSNICIPFTRIR